MQPAPLARVVRSGLEESVHLGHIAVCDADGRVVAQAGDASHPVFSRSCIKPLQAAVSLSAIDVDQPDREVAVMCASHNGEPTHLRAVRAILRRARAHVDSLQTPLGYPLDPDAMARARQRTRLFHNCSGKHAGMLLACSRSGWAHRTYRARSHPLQRRIASAVRSGTDVRDPEIGIDGCGVPVFGMPLHSMATLFARLARPDRFGSLAPSVSRATGAMLAAPYIVGGRDRLDTEIMRVAQGQVIVKEGAEALVCASIMTSGLGVAIKVADGGARADEPALVSVLQQLDALTSAQVRAVANFAVPPILGGVRRVGSVEPLVRLQRR
ncbi:MAG TPA: asparaginase [Actinomycetota bacterium]